MKKKTFRKRRIENILSNICATVVGGMLVAMVLILFFAGEEPRTDPEYLAMVERVQMAERINEYGEVD